MTAVATLSLLDENIRDNVTRSLCLLPVITVCLKHRQARVRYGACLCIRSLSRSVRVLRTSLLDSGAGLALADIVKNKKEDKRVLNMALSGLCNLLNDCSPLRKVRFITLVYSAEQKALIRTAYHGNGRWHRDKALR